MAEAVVSVLTALPGARRRRGERQVFVPALDRFPAALRELMGVLPVCDINASLMAALAHRAMPRHLVAGLFAVDPFLDVRELATALRRAGLSEVANYPTVQLLDGATGDGLAAVGYHARAEFMRLKEFMAAGFEALAYVASPHAAEEALALGLTRIVVHPGLQPGMTRASLARITALAREAAAELLLHRS